MVLGEARHGEVPAELLDVVGGGSEEVDSLEVRHGLPGAGGVVHGLDEEDLLPQQIRLAVHHAHHPNLGGGHGIWSDQKPGRSGPRAAGREPELRSPGGGRGRTYGLGVEDEDLHARDVVEHAVDVVADESDQHHY